jgi:hypothetical protein
LPFPKDVSFPIALLLDLITNFHHREVVFYYCQIRYKTTIDLAKIPLSLLYPSSLRSKTFRIACWAVINLQACNCKSQLNFSLTMDCSNFKAFDNDCTEELAGGADTTMVGPGFRSFSFLPDMGPRFSRFSSLLRLRGVKPKSLGFLSPVDDTILTMGQLSG